MSCRAQLLPAGQAAPHPPAQPAGFLRVQGREIVDAAGRPVYLRGVNMDTYYYSFSWDPGAPWRYATEDDVRLLAGMGATAIRLGLHWRYFETSLGFDLIDTYLAWCEPAGIYVILDMHVVPPEDDILQGRIWDDPAAQQQFLDLWSAIAARYAGRTAVAGYDLYNEPAPPDPARWWDLVDRAVAAVRTVDENHILFVENPLLDGAGFQRVDDVNVVYSYHDYSPFVVSHARADWVGDSPVPDDWAYPGPVLVGVEWADWSQDAADFGGQAPNWLYWDSGPLAVPAGVEFATLKPLAWGNAGDVWFDDLSLLHNGLPRTVTNPGAEEASAHEPDRPANWYFWSDSGFAGAWSDEVAHGGTYSLKISGTGDGFGLWQQANWILTEPLFRVVAGDTLQVRGWLRAPANAGGGVGLGVDYMNGVYENYDRARLRADVQPYLDWAAAQDVPLFVGEFGAMSAAPGDSRPNLVRDKIAVMNETGLHWSLWTFANLDGAGFGLVQDGILDQALYGVLRLGLSPQRTFIPLVQSSRFER